MSTLLDVERYRLAYAEYRAEVSLGHERQTFFLALNPLIVAVAGWGKSPGLAALALVFAAMASAVGMFVVSRSHLRYRRTRYALLDVARALGTETDWQTTGGMREALGMPRFEGMRVTTAVRALLLAYVVADVAAAAALLWERG